MDPLNYRPISLLTIVNKVMESIIAVRIKFFVFSNRLISDHQFGFRPGPLYLGHAASTLPTMLEALNIRHEIRAISLDIS